MSERPDPHARTEAVGPQGQPDDRGEANAHGDAAHADQGHGGETLGPIDVQAWGGAAIGALLGLVVLLAFVQALA